jgi:type IV pilus assembly protein PilM
MSWNPFRSQFGSKFGGLQSRFVLPPLILEIEPTFVAGARLEGSKHVLRRIGMRELAPATIDPIPNGVNIANLEELRRALLGVSQVVGNGTGRLGLLLPDGAVRVLILDFEALPDDRGEAETLVRWRLKESLSFPPEEAKICYQVALPPKNRFSESMSKPWG